MERYRTYLPVMPAPHCDLFICYVGHKRHLIPVAGTLDQMEEHLRQENTQQNNLSSNLINNLKSKWET
jgi:hypothetical protein